MKEVTETKTAWSLGIVSYNWTTLTEWWIGTRLETGARVTRELAKPLPDIFLAELPPPAQEGDQCFVLTDSALEAYERLAIPPAD